MSLFAAARVENLEGGGFRTPDNAEIEVPGTRPAEILRQLVAARPERLSVAELVEQPNEALILLDLFDRDLLALHTVPGPFAHAMPERPVASPLARAMVAEGQNWVCALDHTMVGVPDARLRTFLGRLDGSVAAADLGQLGLECGLDALTDGHDAGAQGLRRALLIQT
jgi:hypothetical protein